MMPDETLIRSIVSLHSARKMNGALSSIAKYRAPRMTNLFRRLYSFWETDSGDK